MRVCFHNTKCFLIYHVAHPLEALGVFPAYTGQLSALTLVFDYLGILRGSIHTPYFISVHRIAETLLLVATMKSISLLPLSLLVLRASAQAATFVSPTHDGVYLADYALAPSHSTSNIALSLINATFQGATDAAGSFTSGPWGMAGGALLTTGLAMDAGRETSAIGTQSNDNKADGSRYCSSECESFDVATLSMEVRLAPGYSGISSTLIYATKYVQHCHGSPIDCPQSAYNWVSVIQETP